MRRVPAWVAYDRMAATGEYGVLLHDAGQVRLPSDGEEGAAFFRMALQRCHWALDLGCGPGFPLLVLAESLPAIVGVDAAPAMLALAQRNATVLGRHNTRLVRALGEALPFGDGTFDGAAECGALGSVAEPGPVVHELARVIRPGGVVASLEQDFRWRLASGSPREERSLQRLPDGLLLRVVRYGKAPYRIREERYTLDGDHPVCARLLLEGQVTARLLPEEIPSDALRDASCEEQAQFAPETLIEVFGEAGFSLVEQRIAPHYGVPHIFSVFRRAPCR